MKKIFASLLFFFAFALNTQAQKIAIDAAKVPQDIKDECNEKMGGKKLLKWFSEKKQGVNEPEYSAQYILAKK